MKPYQIILIIIECIVCAADIAISAIMLKKLPGKQQKYLEYDVNNQTKKNYNSKYSYEKYRANRYELSVTAVIIVNAVAAAICFTANLFDGLSDNDYLAVPFVLAFVGFLLPAVPLTLFYKKTEDKYSIDYFTSDIADRPRYDQMTGMVTRRKTYIRAIFFGLLTAFFMMVPFAISVYSIILLCV
ncbi:MAG: hypothetical protein LUF82_03900 [Clostridia bacterium]|nr:hypothetical protein [Clostridia bacterium]